MYSFIWDDDKEEKNIAKHKINFDEAVSVFCDANARLIYDPDHSDDEDRFILMGISNVLRILMVCHCYKKNENEIRIFSARKATPKEQKQYGGKL